MGDEALEQHYSTLWRSALESFHQSHVDVDHHLKEKHEDRRKGMTLIIRPSLEVAHQISLFLSELATVESNQYFYHTAEFHVTLLSLFSATEHYEPYFANKSAYVRAVDEVLSHARPFAISFRGITASPNAVMIQGFPQDDMLNLLRNQLRLQLSREGLSNGLDQRYKISAAHITVFRFQQQPSNIEQFLEYLHKYRSYNFGTMDACSVQMVENDWYMSGNKVEVIKEWEIV